MPAVYPDKQESSPLRVMVSAYACQPDAGSEMGTGWNWVFYLAKAGCVLEVFTAARYRDPIESYLVTNPMPTVRFHFVKVAGVSPWAIGARHYLPWHWNMYRQARVRAREQDFDIALHVSYGSVHVPTQMWRLGLPTIFGPVGGGQVAPEALMSYFGGARKKERMRTLLTRFLQYVPVYRQSMRAMRITLGDRACPPAA